MEGVVGGVALVGIEPGHERVQARFLSAQRTSSTACVAHHCCERLSSGASGERHHVCNDAKVIEDQIAAERTLNGKMKVEMGGGDLGTLN